jgi:hypothetical protein
MFETDKAVCAFTLKGWDITASPTIMFGNTDNNITIISSPNVIVILRIRFIPLCVL